MSLSRYTLRTLLRQRVATYTINCYRKLSIVIHITKYRPSHLTLHAATNIIAARRHRSIFRSIDEQRAPRHCCCSRSCNDTCRQAAVQDRFACPTVRLDSTSLSAVADADLQGVCTAAITTDQYLL